MTSKEFVIVKLNDIVKEFPLISVRYENSDSTTHFVEILPKTIYDSPEYKNYENRLLSEFIEKFPYENICFISDDVLVGIDVVDWEGKGENFGKPYSTYFDTYKNIVYRLMSRNMKSKTKYQEIETNYNNISTQITLSKFRFNVAVNLPIENLSVGNPSPVTTAPSIDESPYAMAA